MQDGLPRVGVPAFVNVIEYGFRPASFARRHARLGKTYRMRGPNGEILVTADPRHIRHIIAADTDAFESISATLPWLFGPRSVLVTYGQLHKKQRKLLSPPLNGARLRAFGETMLEHAARRVHALREGEEFVALDFSTAYALDIILRNVFGVEAGQDTEELREILLGVVRTARPSLFFFPWLHRDWFSPWREFCETRQRYQSWVREEIRRRRSTARDRSDVLSLLIDARYDDGSGMDDDEIADQLIGLLLVGHETTAIAIAAFLDHVHHTPNVLPTLRAELDAAELTPEGVQNLPYLSAAISETLRCDTVVTDLTRVAKVPFELAGGLRLAPGDMVMVLVEALHADAELYPSPLEFRPERFLERKYAPHEYMPFGGGVRRCLGAAFSDYETKILLATLLKHAELEPSLGRPDKRVRRNITMGPKVGVPMRVRRLRQPGRSLPIPNAMKPANV